MQQGLWGRRFGFARASMLALCLAVASAASAQPAAVASAPPGAPTLVWPGQDWATSTPEEAGMDARALDDLVAFGAANDMDSMVITRHGRLVREAYYGDFKAEQKHRLNSEIGRASCRERV